MPSRYFEVIITGRQLAGLLAALVVLLLAAFGLGVAVRLVEPEPVQAVPFVMAAASPTATPEPPAPTPEPTVVPTEPPPPPVVPTTAPTQPPPAVAPETPLPLPPPTVGPTPRPEPSPVAVTPAGGVWVQVAAVSRPDLAEGVKQRVMAFGFRREQLRVLTTQQGLFKVRLGPFPDLESAGRVVGRLQEAGFEGPFIVKE